MGDVRAGVAPIARRTIRSGAPRRIVGAIAVALACTLPAPSVSAGDVSNATMQSLDEQVQEIKSDVLAIATELTRLEEKLLYPSDTQVAVFVAIAPEDEARFDSIEIAFDGEPVARHVYSFKELEALRKGGVQRLYTGNLPTGAHRLDVTIAGQRPNGDDFSGAGSFRIEKAVAPKLVEIELAAGTAGDAKIRLGDD